MIKNKKMIMAFSFCLGAIMLATTAFADITTKTGYDQLKDSLKSTAEYMTEKLQSFTTLGVTTLKDNNNVLMTSSSTSKYNNNKKQFEMTNTDERVNGSKRTSYSYSDEDGTISHSSDNDIYYVSKFSGKNVNFNRAKSNPFKQSVSKDVEKIADALIGNLKDYIIVNDKADGSKELTGSISEAQIPALVNAVASLGVKQIFTENRYTGSPMENMPALVDDIFVKSGKANINVNKDGIIESVMASAILSGKDKSGSVHDITFECLFRITDINNTTVTKPDLTGKKQEEINQVNNEDGKLPSSFIGKYSNNIVITKNNQYIKVGDRFIEITDIKDNHIIGKFYEVYKSEYQSQYAKSSYNFDAVMNNPNNGDFSVTDSEGKKVSGSISWNVQTGNIYFYTNQQINNSDGNFTRVFD